MRGRPVMEKSLIAWNLPNLISLFLMIGCVWGIAALLGKAARKTVGKDTTE